MLVGRKYENNWPDYTRVKHVLPQGKTNCSFRRKEGKTQMKFQGGGTKIKNCVTMKGKEFSRLTCSW